MILTDVLGIVVKSSNIIQRRKKLLRNVDIVDNSQQGGAKVGNYLNLHWLFLIIIYYFSIKYTSLNCQRCIIVGLFTH